MDYEDALFLKNIAIPVVVRYAVGQLLLRIERVL